MTTQWTQKTGYFLAALFAVLAIRSAPCIAEPPRKESTTPLSDVRSIELRGSEPVLLSIQVGGQTARLLISTLGNCITFTQIADGLGQLPVKRVEASDEGQPPSPQEMPPLPPSSQATPSTPTETPSQLPPQVPTVPASNGPDRAASSTTVSQAEVSSNFETKPTDSVVGSEDIHLKASEFTPILPADRPDWVGRTIIEAGAVHFISVGAFPDLSFEKSRTTLDDSLLKEARKYVDEHVLHQEGAAEQLAQFNLDFIKSKWLIPSQEYDAQFDTTSATYHQAWVELAIQERDRRMIEHWWKDIVRHERAKKLGGGLAASIAGVGMLHLLFGMIARRKSKK